MHPANFPARVDARRLSALSRLGTSPKTKLTAEQINVETQRLQAKLNPEARGIRSKKLRGQRRSAS